MSRKDRPSFDASQRKARDAADPERAALGELRKTLGRDVSAWPPPERARYHNWEAARLERKVNHADAEAAAVRVLYARAVEAMRAAQAEAAEAERTAAEAPTEDALRAAAEAEVEAIASAPAPKRSRKVTRG